MRKIEFEINILTSKSSRITINL